MRSSVVYNLCLLWAKMTCCMPFTCFIKFTFDWFLVLTTRGETTAEKLKFWNWFSPWHACCRLGYTRPREPTNERRSHQNEGFSIWLFKNFPGVIPRTPTAGEGDPLPHPLPARPLAGRGAQAPRCWDPNLGPPQLFSRGCAPRPLWLRSCDVQHIRLPRMLLLSRIHLTIHLVGQRERERWALRWLQPWHPCTAIVKILLKVFVFTSCVIRMIFTDFGQLTMSFYVGQILPTLSRQCGHILLIWFQSKFYCYLHIMYFHRYLYNVYIYFVLPSGVIRNVSPPKPNQLLPCSHISHPLQKFHQNSS